MRYKNTKGYYHFCDDLNKYSDAWCYVVWSPRGVGKTYSALSYSLCKCIIPVYIKRTKNDVNMICNENKVGFDASPYVPINRDYGTDVKAKRLEDGIGAFYYKDDAKPVSYVVALSAAKSLKGFDLSEADWMLFDEFIPQAGEVVRHTEGEQILDLYLTIRRDREKRGRDPLRMILFANAENIATPITNTLEIVDVMADMNIKHTEYDYNAERGILLHRIPATDEQEESGGIYKAMGKTAWGRKAFGGEFSNNDFSCVKQISLKGFVPVCKYTYKQDDHFIYRRNADGAYYVCNSAAHGVQAYDLNRETEQLRFRYDIVVDLMEMCIEGKAYFQYYSMYDLFFNYSKYFHN